MAGGDAQRSSRSDRRRRANNEMDSVLKIPSGLRSWREDFTLIRLRAKKRARWIWSFEPLVRATVKIGLAN